MDVRLYPEYLVETAFERGLVPDLEAARQLVAAACEAAPAAAFDLHSWDRHHRYFVAGDPAALVAAALGLEEGALAPSEE